MSVMRHGRASDVVTPALFVALLAGSAMVAIPVGSVPFTLQVMVVVAVALLLEPRQAIMALGVYLLAGAIGLPVFSGMRGGIGVLAGPTGGYLLGFVVGAPLGAYVRMHFAGRAGDWIAAAVVVCVTYTAGWMQLALVTGMSGGEAFAVGVAPFVLPDVAKAIAAVAVVRAVRRARGSRGVLASEDPSVS